MLMDIALVVKLRSTCLRRQVGAVLAVDGRVLSSGYNGAPGGLPHCIPQTCSDERPCIDTVHGEANAIAFAARYGIRIEGSTLYTTASPCRACAILLINAGIIRVVYDERYRDTTPIEVMEKAGVVVERWVPVDALP
jgi:dCMP deaminase